MFILVIQLTAREGLYGEFNSCRFLGPDAQGPNGCQEIYKAVVVLEFINLIVQLVPLIVLGVALVLIRQITVQ